MDNAKQKRRLTFPLGNVAAFFVLLFMWQLAYGQVAHSSSQVPLGNSDTNGFVRIDKIFYEMSLEKGGDADFFFKFSSDPRQEPKYLGAYWTIPFFDSKAFKISPNRYRWIAPNLRTYTFNKIQNPEKGYKKTYILNTTGKWKLNVGKDNLIYIENKDDSKNKFILKNGKLVSFCCGKGSDTVRISYENGDCPRSVYNVDKSSMEMELKYNQERLLSQIIFPKDKKSLLITYGACDTIAEDGVSRNGNRLKSVSSITFTSGQKEEYKYIGCANKKIRTILTKYEDKKTAAKVSVNRFEQSIGGNDKGYIEWDATTGIIISDSGGEYWVRNPIFDRHSIEYGDYIFATDRKREMRTKESRISYKKPENKYAEIWDYSLRTAVKITQNPTTGEQTRTSYIGSPGNTSMKVRKIEKKLPNSKDWKIHLTRAYNEKGDLIREIGEDGNSAEFIYDKNGSHWKTLKNGDIVYVAYNNYMDIKYMLKTDEGNITKIVQTKGSPIYRLESKISGKDYIATVDVKNYILKINKLNINIEKQSNNNKI